MAAYTVELPGEVICKESGFNSRSCSELNNIGTHPCGSVTVDHVPLRMSYYKVEVSVNGNLEVYFYYDNRDDSFNSLRCGNNSCTGNDFTVRYNFTTEVLEFYKNSTISTIIIPDLELSNGDVITWSDWKCDEPDFIPFWLINIIEENGFPKLMWGPYNDGISTSEYYKIYRAVTTSSTPPALSSFTLVKTISNPATYSWIDDDWLYGGLNYAHYYIKAGLLPSEELSDPTEVGTVGVSAYKQSSDITNVFTEYKLNQNYPNPFNPTSNKLFNKGEWLCIINSL